MCTACFHTHAIERLMGMEYLRVRTIQTDSAYRPQKVGMHRVDVDPVPGEVAQSHPEGLRAVQLRSAEGEREAVRG